MIRGYLIDTCIWIDVEQGRLGPSDVAGVTGEAPVFLSPVTLAELKLGVEICADPAIRQQRQVTFRRMLRKPVLQIDGGTSEVFGEIAAAILQTARQPSAGHRHRTQDLWLAAQAIQHDLHLLTRNQRDFRDIPGLRLTGIG